MITDEWRKSSRSGANGDCVEVRRSGERVEVRDSKNPERPALSFTESEWRAFLGGAADGEFDL